MAYSGRATERWLLECRAYGVLRMARTVRMSRTVVLEHEAYDVLRIVFVRKSQTMVVEHEAYSVWRIAYCV